MDTLTVLSVVFSVIDKTPVWRSAVERALTIAVSCAAALTVMSLFDFGPVTFAWGTPLAATLVRWMAFLGSTSLVEGSHQFQRELVRGLRSAARVIAYVTVPSIVFNLIWPLTGPGTVAHTLVVCVVAGTLALPVELAVLALGQGENILAAQKVSQTAEKAVLAAENEPGEDTIDESNVSAVDLDAQLAFRYQRAREEAEAEVRRYLPTNPRTAKRMVNHVSLTMAIAEQRGLFRDPNLTQQHLGKWIGLSEQWPALGAALTAAPERIADLEKATSLAELQEILDNIAPGTMASDEMRRRLREGAPLNGILDKLVRFEAS